MVLTSKDSNKCNNTIMYYNKNLVFYVDTYLYIYILLKLNLKDLFATLYTSRSMMR